MKLATITEKAASDRKSEASNGIAIPQSFDEAHRLFWKGMRAFNRGRSRAAFRIFNRLADYQGGPADLAKAIRMMRNFLDPNKTAEEKAEEYLKDNPPRIITIYNANAGNTAGTDEFAEPERAALRLDPPALSWIVANDLIASAFRALERGELDEADRIFADFLDRTEDEPSAALRATAMIARREISLQREAKTCDVEPS